MYNWNINLKVKKNKKGIYLEPDFEEDIPRLNNGKAND